MGDLSSNWYFSESDTHYERKSSSLNLFSKKNDQSLNYRWYARAWFYRAHADQLDFLKYNKINSRMNRGTSEGSETSAGEYSTRWIQICVIYFCLGNIWKVILKEEVKNKFYKNRPDRSVCSLPRAFQWWSGNCRSPYGFFRDFFVGL